MLSSVEIMHILFVVNVKGDRIVFFLKLRSTECEEVGRHCCWGLVSSLEEKV